MIVGNFHHQADHGHCCERVGARQGEIEHQPLHHLVGFVREDVDAFEQIDTDDDKEQRSGLKQHTAEYRSAVSAS